MEKIFDNPTSLEALVKQKYGFPDFVMMENAALALKDLVSKTAAPKASVLILCGKGNNGGDGYALARLLYNTFNVYLYKYEEPSALEAINQYKICKNLKLNFINSKKVLELLKAPDQKTGPLVIVDCLFGTGFRGQLPTRLQTIINTANNAAAIRIACDISSGLAFDADYTVTMGEHKLALFSDTAKAVSGKIIVADLGLEPEIFQSQAKPTAFLVTARDVKLPFRTDKASHKGTYGHTAVFAGEKAGAAIICATAAMNFGSGLTTLIKTPDSNLEQFKISPELMICSQGIPAKANCIVFGPGMNEQALPDNSIEKVLCTVFDAGVFANPKFPELLARLDARPDSRIVLTPHLLESARLCKNLGIKPAPVVQDLVQNPELKIKIGQKINKLFPNTVLVIKSANTFIAAGGQTYIVNNGCPSLAKGGSGDVLAGMIAALLAQGYTAKDAAITACYSHAAAAQKKGASSYSLTPLKLIKALDNLTFHP